MFITFIHNSHWGVQIRGDERGLYEKARKFRDSGLELFVLEKTPSFQEDYGEKVYHSLKIENTRIPPRNLKDLTKLVLSSLFAILRSGNILLHPIAVYAYNQDLENVFVGYVIKILTGSKLVVVYHQLSPRFVNPFWSSFFRRRSLGSRLQTSLRRSLLPALNRFALRHADINIAVSVAAKQEALDLVGVKRCTVIGNGIDSQKFRPLNLPKVYEAAYFGRLAPQKGIDVLLRAWRNVVDKYQTARLILIGGSEEEDLQEYKKMIKELSLEKNTLLTGFLEDEEVIKLLSSSKLYVFPSRHDGFAQTVSQAMACGMCCVLSDIPALIEIYGRGAVFVPVDNVEALADTIISLLGDDRKREEFSSRARDCVIGLKWEDTVHKELSIILHKDQI